MQCSQHAWLISYTMLRGSRHWLAGVARSITQPARCLFTAFHTPCDRTAQVAAGAEPEAVAQLLQAAARPVEDRLRGWGDAAAAQFGADGATDSWDSDVSEEETPEQKYMRACPACRACHCVAWAASAAISA